MREKTNFDKTFHLRRENKKLIMKSGKFQNKVNNTVNNNLEVFNLRLLTNLKSISFQEKVINLSMKNFYELLSKTLIMDRKTKSLNISQKLSNLNINNIDDIQECDILFYIHGGGFLSQSTESVIGYLSE
jgi:NCAIR mutase (PurE)-related protein